MTTIVGISGSLRKDSFNAGLLRAAAEAVPEGCSLTLGTIQGIPLFQCPPWQPTVTVGGSNWPSGSFAYQAVASGASSNRTTLIRQLSR